MRILFSSDLHACKPVFELFATTLAAGPYDAGVLAGDLLDELWLPDAMLMELSGVSSDDIDDELPAATGSGHPVASVAREAANHRGLLAMEAVLTGILEAAGKPVLLIPGNHDTTPWAGRGQVRNIHGCRVDLGGWNFVGWRWAPPFEPAPPADLQADLDRTARLVDRKTVLVSHNAPWGVLDRFFGCPAGSRPLAAMVRRQKPTWHLFGHFHSQFGRQGRRLNGCWPEAQAFWDIELGSGECRRVAAKVANLAGLVSWR